MKKIKTTTKIFFKLLAINLLMLNVSCENPSITEAPPPFIQIITGPKDKSVINVNYVSFTWKGSDNNYKFSYRLLVKDNDNFNQTFLDWSTPSKTATEVIFSDLDEGMFTFEIKGESDGELGTESRTFEIDAVQGSSLMFFKTKTELAVGAEKTIGIWMEDVDSLTAFRLIIGFDTSMVSMLKISDGDYVDHKNFSQLILPGDLRTSASNSINTINKSGKIEVYSSVLTTIQADFAKSISGSGELLKMDFRAKKKGQTYLEFSLVELYNPKGKLIQSYAPRKGIIIIE
ncbi:MAG: hypothetical protein KJ799_08380 [Bacteroidetes bacterium]|nr:hypothetical protein [Bacteroidota bacterium]MBU1678554.1 hypothetical protein [Bacteroidota bacterium]MBU2506727.1 hypothetical protein [Bacteroidota bacterium]